MVNVSVIFPQTAVFSNVPSGRIYPSPVAQLCEFSHECSECTLRGEHIMPNSTPSREVRPLNRSDGEIDFFCLWKKVNSDVASHAGERREEKIERVIEGQVPFWESEWKNRKERKGISWRIVIQFFIRHCLSNFTSKLQKAAQLPHIPEFPSDVREIYNLRTF